jgi:hypothetical protein
MSTQPAPFSLAVSAPGKSRSSGAVLPAVLVSKVSVPTPISDDRKTLRWAAEFVPTTDCDVVVSSAKYTVGAAVATLAQHIAASAVIEALKFLEVFMVTAVGVGYSEKCMNAGRLPRQTFYDLAGVVVRHQEGGPHTSIRRT